ncbi:hypothetical protein Godav_014282, partial [Gossypium davidsonii]|nr:hypothetical protein [Gossypium davidsonii]
MSGTNLVNCPSNSGSKAVNSRNQTLECSVAKNKSSGWCIRHSPLYLQMQLVGMMEGAKRHYEKDRPRSESAGKSSQVGWVSGTGNRETIVKQVGLGDKQKLREAEKAENLMHLICFGPC